MSRQWRRRVSAIEKDAKGLLAEAGSGCPPIDVRAIARHVGIRIRPSSFKDDVSGLLVLKDGTPTIGFNGLHSRVRQRFTIAHELGHYALHRGDAKLFVDKRYNSVFFRDEDSSKGKYRQELEANAFAAALLMPIGLIQDVIGKRGFDLAEEDALDELAQLFDVSRQAMAYRLANSDIFSSAPEML